MANAIDMTTLSDVKSWLGLTVSTDDAQISRLITAASDWIQNYLSRDIVVTTYTDEIYHGNGQVQLMLRQYPIVAVSSVQVISGSTVLATYAASDVYFDDRSVYLKSGTFPRGQGNIKITYQAGYTTIPFTLQQATIELVAMRYREKDRVGHVSKQLGGETVTFNISDMPNSVRTILNNNANVVPV